MNVRCVNPKNYRLNRGQVYQAENAENPSYYIIINERGRRVRYAKNLFEAAEQEEIPAQQPGLPPDTPLENVARHIFEENDITVGGNNIRVGFNLINNASGVSCGVSSISGLNSQCANIAEHFGDEDATRVLSDLLQLKIESLQEDAVLFLFSTNVDGNEWYDTIERAIQGMHDFTVLSDHTANNPNTDNDITLWVVE